MKENKNITKREIDLTRADDAILDPSLNLLFQNGWEIFSSIPVEDRGKPKLILFFKPPKKEKETYKKMEILIKIHLFFLVLISILLFLNIYRG